IIFRGVNIYPGQIDEVLSTIEDISCEYQVILDREDDGKDYMTIRLECLESDKPEQLTDVQKKIAAAIKKKIMISCDVEVLDYCSLPRSERKSKRFFDNRGL
ncbi:MAG: phenylacetate--CoA ligase family protein, partial [Desulfobacterales bacterium]|nr:phenylacetate--CoA ligase family protein [Desulfobacterales bacterium]